MKEMLIALSLDALLLEMEVEQGIEEPIEKVDSEK